MALALGTAQFGLKYGIANDTGKIQPKKILDILKLAEKNNVEYIDTSPVYGNSEDLLGRYFRNQSNSSFKVISKIPSLRKNNVNDDRLVPRILSSVEKSLQRLNQSKLHGLLLHDPRDTLEYGKKIISALDNIRNKKYIENVGISVYYPKEISHEINLSNLDIVQIPFNVFDRRFIAPEMIKIYKKHNLTVQARSIFLQGLFFKKNGQLPKNIEFMQSKLNQIQNYFQEKNISLAHGLIQFAKQHDSIDLLTIGIDSIDQLKENLNYLADPIPSDCIDFLKSSERKINQEEVLNPDLWKTAHLQ